jgi:hypothetical protein
MSFVRFLGSSIQLNSFSMTPSSRRRAAAEPNMRRDASLVGEINQRSGVIANDTIDLSALSARCRDPMDPAREIIGDFFLEKPFAFDPLWVAVHCQWAST